MSVNRSDKPPYIFRDGGVMFAPPYLQAHTFLCGWLLPSSRAAQQRLLDQTVNPVVAGSGLRYQAVFPRALLSFADIKEVTSLAEEHAQHGFVSERDVTIWFLAAARRGDTVERLVWFLPYIWVDSAMAVAVGREVFGFPKQLARLHIPAHHRDTSGPFFADADVLASYGRRTAARPERLLELRTSGLESLTGAAEEEGVEIDRLGGLFPDEDQPAPALGGGEGGEGLEGRLASAGNLVAQFASNLRQRALPILFLKQFPDATQPGRACYQRVVEAPARVVELEKVGLMPGYWTADLHSFDSHRLHANLGLPEGPIELGRGLYVRYSFTVDVGVEID